MATARRLMDKKSSWNREVKEAKRRHYTDDQFAEIVAAAKLKPDADLKRFREALERRAWFYLEAARLAEKTARPYQRAPKLKRLSGKVSALENALAEVRDDPYLNDALNQAAREVDTGYIDYDGGSVQKIVGGLAWLRAAIEKAKCHSAGGESSKADMALYELILAVMDFYRSVAAEPHQPSGWSAHDDAEFWVFAQKIMTPLGVKKSNDALWQIYRRAVSPNPGTK